MQTCQNALKAYFFFFLGALSSSIIPFALSANCEVKKPFSLLTSFSFPFHLSSSFSSVGKSSPQWTILFILVSLFVSSFLSLPLLVTYLVSKPCSSWTIPFCGKGTLFLSLHFSSLVNFIIDKPNGSWTHTFTDEADSFHSFSLFHPSSLAANTLVGKLSSLWTKNLSTKDHTLSFSPSSANHQNGKPRNLSWQNWWLMNQPISQQNLT